MRLLGVFEEFLKSGVVSKVSVNRERALSLLLDAQRKMRSLEQRLIRMGIDGDNSNDYVEHCYDLLMELVRAKMHIDGYSSQGQGAHEAEVSYLVVLNFVESDVRFLDQMRYFRNGILYYGTSLDEEYADKVVKFTQRFFLLLVRVVDPSFQKK